MNQGWQRFIDLLVAMSTKELKARYKHTIFGFLWILINPLMQMVVIGFVFRFFLKEPVNNYFYFLFIGLLVWQFFTQSIMTATPSVVYERALIKKARFPYAVIPLSIVASNFVNLILAFCLYLIPVSFLGNLGSTAMWAVPSALLMLVIFTSGLAMLTSSLNVRYRDVQFFMQSLLLLWFYATPILYSIEMIPNEIVWLWRLNPLTSIVLFFHSSLLGFQPPEMMILVSNTVLIALVFVVGVITFFLQGKYFDDLL